VVYSMLNSHSVAGDLRAPQIQIVHQHPELIRSNSPQLAPGHTKVTTQNGTIR